MIALPSRRPTAGIQGPTFDGSFDAEVAVIGVGSTGSMALWQLARRGISVLGFEQFTPGHDRGAAGGESRVFRIAYHEGTHYVPLLLAARDAWGQLEETAHAELLDRCGYIEIAKSDDEGFARSMASLAEHGLAHEVLAAESARDRFPQHRIRDDDVALLDPLGGTLRPEYSVVRATVLAEALGARVLRHTPVESIEPGPDGVAVRAASRNWRFRRAVITVGSWASRLTSDHPATEIAITTARATAGQPVSRTPPHVPVLRELSVPGLALKKITYDPPGFSTGREDHS
jgi:sarcosine oxidase